MLYDSKSTIQVVGTKQTMKYLEKGNAKLVFVAKDADDHVTSQVVELAKAKEIQVEFVETMKELGQKCNVEVKTAVAAIIE